MEVILLIPAFNPTSVLIDTVSEVLKGGIERVVVVDDGSRPECAEIFSALKGIGNVTVLTHAVNLGKGSALKTGLNYIYVHHPAALGVVTADADGQHLPHDIMRIAEKLRTSDESLVLGVRSFDRKVPLRSRFGNILTQKFFWLISGTKVTDTQTGLRGIPRSLIPMLLRLRPNGYEYELDMILSAKSSHLAILEEPIQTVYIDGNKSSHFNPILDSMKIYFVLFRFVAVALLTGLLDYLVFRFVFNMNQNILVSQLVARSVAIFFNYFSVKNAVFGSADAHKQTLPKYLLLVAVSGFFSYAMIGLFVREFAIGVLLAKVLAEGVMFLSNFAIQRLFIFSSDKQSTKTDWDKYYAKPYKTASLTRKVTQSVLVNMMREYGKETSAPLHIVELGGANSCFYNGIVKEIQPNAYSIVDNNSRGLEKFEQRIQITQASHDVKLYHSDVLDMKQASADHDLAFSVGLIEHFSADDTKKAILTHFELLKPGGIAIISYPTPTWLYRVTRFFAELFGLWIFHDERPLRREEVIGAVKGHADILREKTIWPIFLTQHMMVFRKNG